MSEDRLRLRRFCHDDIPMMLAMESDPEVMLHSTGIIEATLERQAALRAWMELPQDDLGHWAIDVRGQAQGWVSLTPLADTGRIQLAYRLRRSAWGRGWALLACRDVLTHAWEAVRLAGVAAVVWPENVRSRRLLEKLGFLEEGEGIYYQRRVCIYGLSRPDFR